MITKAQAMTAEHFHAGDCKRTIGPRGGVTEKIEAWRRNGRTQTWKTRPEDFRVPIKHGLYAYSEITPRNAHMLHTAEDCPLAEPQRMADDGVASMEATIAATGKVPKTRPHDPATCEIKLWGRCLSCEIIAREGA